MTSPPALADILDRIALPDLPGGARVVVAMSGGVDSSVVAALLVHAGYDVVGVTLQLYDTARRCTGRAPAVRARTFTMLAG